MCDLYFFREPEEIEKDEQVRVLEFITQVCLSKNMVVPSKSVLLAEESVGRIFCPRSVFYYWFSSFTFSTAIQT